MFSLCVSAFFTGFIYVAGCIHSVDVYTKYPIISWFLNCGVIDILSWVILSYRDCPMQYRVFSNISLASPH